MLRVVLNRPGKVPQRLVRAPEVPVRLALPRPVAHLLGNRQVLRVVLNRPGKVPQRVVRVPKHAVDSTRQAGMRHPHVPRKRQSLALQRCDAPPVGRLLQLAQPSRQALRVVVDRL